MTITDVDDDTFAWRESGTGSLLLLLHGLGGSRLSWEPQLIGLMSHNRVVAWDMPGYGGSRDLGGTMSFTAMADAVVDLADVLGAERVHLAGISFGGMIAQYVAANHPSRVASLTLMSTSPTFGLDGTTPDEWRAARLAPLEAGLEPADFSVDVLAAIAGPHISSDAMAGQRAAMARVSGNALRRSIDCLVTHDSRDLLPSVSCPTVCVVGELDEETPVAYAFALADLIPHSRLLVVPHAGHLVNVEAPEAVNDVLREHIERAEMQEAAR